MPERGASVKQETRPINAIQVGNRHREDVGDLDDLMQSIERIGLLHPIVIRPDDSLVAGERRLRACEKLGWTDVPVRIVDDLGDSVEALIAERDENTCRLDMTASEKVALGKRLEELERPKAEARKITGLKRGAESRGVNLTSPIKRGETAELVSKAVGMSKNTFNRAKQVVEAAEDESLPEEVRQVTTEAKEEMDRTGKVTPAYDKVASVTNRRPISWSSRIPAGMTAEQWIRRAMERDQNGATSAEAAAAVGIGHSTYRQARYVLLLADRDDLPDRDAALVADAVAVMNERRVIRPAYEKVHRIVDRVYGEGRQRVVGPSRAEKNRRAAFEHACGAILSICLGAPTVSIPYLTEHERKGAISDIQKAISNLHEFRRNIEHA